MEEFDEAREKKAFEAFRKALKADNLKTVKRLMENENKSIKKRSQECGLTSRLYHHFFDSINQGDFKSVKLMLRAGVDRDHVNRLSHEFLGPLKVAIWIVNRRIRLKMVKLLVEHGIGLEEDSSGVRLYQHSCVHDAIRKGDCEMVKFLAENLRANLDHLHRNCEHRAEFAPIHVAVLHVDDVEVSLKMIKQLVELGADVNIKSHQGSTCLHMVCSRQSGSCEVTKLLLSLGAHVNPSIGPGEPFHSSPLVMATFYDDCEVIKLMIDAGAEINTEHWELSALYCAVYERRKNVVRLLLELGADADAKGDNGDNILFQATLRRFGRRTTDSDYVDVLKMLLARCTNKNPTYNENFVPFKNVLRNGNLEAMHLFLQNGVQLKDCGVRCPLHQAACNDHPEILEYLLMSRLFDVDERDKAGVTALYIATSFRNLDCMKLLLDWGADVNILISRDGYDGVKLPILNALINNQGTSADLLLAAGSNLDVNELINPEKEIDLSRWFLDMKTYLIKQIILDQSRGHEINAETERILKELVPTYSEITEQCSTELAALKNSIFFGTVTMYDVLSGKDITKYTANSRVKENVESPEFEKHFPMYGNRIEYIYLLACVRLDVINEAAKSLNKLLGYRFGHGIHHLILSGLKMKDLRNVCHIYTRRSD